MMQVKYNLEAARTAVLQQILHILATNPQPEHSVPSILQAVTAATGASSTCYLLFAELKTCIKVGDDPFSQMETTVESIVGELTPGIHFNPGRDAFNLSSDYVLSPIVLSNRVKGAFGLVFGPGAAVEQQDESLLAAVVDALTTASQFKKLSRNQNEFTRIVSHDLRSPLTYMQGFASMIEMVGELSEKQKYFVEKVLSGINQMTAQVDNIQDAGRYDPETGFYEMSRSHCDLNEIVQKIVENHAIPDEQPQLRVIVKPGHDIPIINADSIMLERAVNNLVDNAIKYSPNGGTVEVSVARRNDVLVISVRDEGVGISPENQKNLFDRHVRIPRPEHKKVKGSGLGLFIVKSVAQRHGGSAWVESVEGKGSTFYMSIPLAGDNLIGAQQ